MPRPSQQGLYWEIPTITFTPETAPTPNYGSPYVFDIAVAGGRYPYTITQSSGSLPNGLVFSTIDSTTVRISGTATEYGTFTFTIHAIDANGYYADHTYSFSVNTPVITVLPTVLPNATAPATYNSLITATGGVAPYTFSVISGSLPTGLNLSSSGTLSGVASVAGTFNFVIRATDSMSSVGTQSYSVTINQLDRAIAKEQTPPRILVVYDTLESPGYVNGWTYSYGYSYPQNGGRDVNPVTIAQSVAGRETVLGFVTTVLTSYSQLLSLSQTEINKFSHIWDVGYRTEITGAVRSKYVQYLQDGGALFLLGENAYFLARDNSIASVVNAVSSGVSVSSSRYGNYLQTTSSEFLLANNTSSVTYYAPGVFQSYGTGTPITSGSGYASGVVWKTGSLGGAPAGAIVSVLDINFIVNPAYGANMGTATWQPWFVDNLSLILNKK